MSGFTAGALECARSRSHEGCAPGLVGGPSDWQFWIVSGTESREKETAKGQMAYSAQSDGERTCRGRTCVRVKKKEKKERNCVHVREEEMEEEPQVCL